MTPGIGQLDAIPGPWGHWSGGPPPLGGGNANLKWLDDHLREFFTHGVKLEGISKLSLNEDSLHKS